MLLTMPLERNSTFSVNILRSLDVWWLHAGQLVERSEVQISAGTEISGDFYFGYTPNQLSYDEHTDHMLSVDDETVRERTGHPPLYAGAKKMKSLTLHTHGSE